MMRSALVGFYRTIIETLVIAQKEITELRRQPAVLLLVVLGPFVVLAAFGLGYRNEELALRTVFVGTADGPYEEAISRYTESIEDYLVPVAFTADFPAAIRDLESERVELVIVLPPDPGQAIGEGQRSEIAVIHNSIDPIERVGIEFATEVAVRELNATVVTAALDSLLNSAREVDRDAGLLSDDLSEVETALLLGNDEEAQRLSANLSRQVREITPSLGLFGERSEAPDQDQDQDQEPSENTEVGRSLAVRIDRYGRGRASAEQLLSIQQELRQIDSQLAALISLDAQTLARPFTGDAEGLTREPVSAEDHVAPGATALLIQHLAISLAALSLVRDRRRGVLTDYRVGPVSVVSVMAGKLIALSAVASAAAAALMASQYWLLGVPFRGSVADAALLVLGLVFASVAAGLVVASLGQTELHASQAAMILLLIALFFSGFFLDLDRLKTPFRSIGFVVPATPVVEGLRDIQLRGSRARPLTYIVLFAQVLIGMSVSTFLLRRQWRTAQ
ncbi:MAG: ABC transporter permease [Acidimicrobiales bacterium]|nr:ABC transporter permease [Acidimicrobiales bacterium]